ncbi:MAG: TlpA family protein disulfide reductase [Atopobiaceae bacterium]|nr:TlpA family protein disulfide reductase [Atopobiaceae bacterium]
MSGKKLPLGLKVLLGLVNVAAVAYAGVNLWLKFNRDKLFDGMVANAGSIDDFVGREMPAFDVEQPDGTHITKDALIAGKEVTAVVLYASWCGPCEKEFPEMDAIYRKYQDRMGMVGIDVDGLDTMEDVRKYQDSHDLTFPLALGAGNESLDFVKTKTYPTTLLVDREGIIRFCRVGSIPTAELFEELVTFFLGDDYVQEEPALYTFVALVKGKAGQGVTFTVMTKDGEQTFVTDEGGTCQVVLRQRGVLPVKVLSAPEGVEIIDGGETTTGMISTLVKLPVR